MLVLMFMTRNENTERLYLPNESSPEFLHIPTEELPLWKFSEILV